MLLTAEEVVVCCTLLGCDSCGYPESKFLEDLKEKGVERPHYAIASLTEKDLVRLDEPNGSHSRKEGVYKPLPLLWKMRDELFSLNRSLGGSDVHEHALAD